MLQLNLTILCRGVTETFEGGNANQASDSVDSSSGVKARCWGICKAHASPLQTAETQLFGTFHHPQETQVTWDAVRHFKME